jgi:hypothetical protein
MACTVTLKYRGKVFGGGTFNGSVPNGQVTIPAPTYSRSRTTRGTKAALSCALAKKQSEVMLKKGQSEELFNAPLQLRTTEGP